MKVTELEFSLPDSLVALKPASPRDSCRLMVLHRDGMIEHKQFSELSEYLERGDLLLLNNTRVFPARLTCTKKTGGRIEILLVKEIATNYWEILSREKFTGKVSISDELSGEMFNGKAIKFNPLTRDSSNSTDIIDTIWDVGHMPLPPYIKRKADESDKEWYQTVYAERTGSIAAPTAGLHFTADLMRRIEEKGVRIGFLTLHVGTGTFKPVRVKNIKDHIMDAEYFEIDTTLVDVIENVKKSGRRIISVGTTTTRAIEGFFSGRYRDSSGSRVTINKSNNKKHSELRTLASASRLRRPNSELNHKNGSMKGTTDIFIYPDYKFMVVDSLITNFHLPESTPLLLTAALSGTRKLMAAYSTAIAMEYRFFSYGDAMLIL